MLKVRTPVFRYKFQTQVGYEDKVATLSDVDSVWTELRHMHMREAIDKLMADFNQFLQNNAGFKGCVVICVQFVIPRFVIFVSAGKVLRT